MMIVVGCCPNNCCNHSQLFPCFLRLNICDVPGGRYYKKNNLKLPTSRIEHVLKKGTG